MDDRKTPIQKILFGSPGTGKSYKVANEIVTELGLEKNSDNIFKTVFHPEYRYGDFVGKLLPHTEGGQITYRYYSGIFLKALGRAYKNILENKAENVLFIIDEINRGNSAAIFGTVFQLLDRDENGYSSYSVGISDLEFEALLKEAGLKRSKDDQSKILTTENSEIELEDLDFLKNSEIKLPANLSIIGTMNTSDESIYYMDSAFKRRWGWEYVPVDGKINKSKCQDTQIATKWDDFYKIINTFILENGTYIHKVEDKLIGKYFLKESERTVDAVQNKLMFFLWDTVFQRDKTPLETLLDEKKLQTFGDFANEVDTFLTKFGIKLQDSDS